MIQIKYMQELCTHRYLVAHNISHVHVFIILGKNVTMAFGQDFIFIYELHVLQKLDFSVALVLFIQNIIRIPVLYIRERESPLVRWIGKL